MITEIFRGSGSFLIFQISHIQELVDLERNFGNLTFRIVTGQFDFLRGAMSC